MPNRTLRIIRLFYLHIVLCTLTCCTYAGGIDNTHTALYVYDLDTQKPLVQHNTDTYLIPASLEKLFTAYAGLSILPKTFFYTTEVGYNGNIHQGHLQGNLIIRFAGDPTLTSQQLQHAFNTVKQGGITHINGDIILVSNSIHSEIYGPGWMWDELDDCYAAPIVDFTVDGNCVHATITPNDKTGQLAHIVLNQPLDQPLHHTVHTVSSDTPICPFVFHRTHEDHYTLTGCIPKRHAPAILDIAIHSPSNNIRAHIKDALQQAGIKQTKAIVFQESTPSKMKPITTITSQPLSTIIQTMLKESDNLIAENLFKKLGYIQHSAYTWPAGQNTVYEILKKQGIAVQKEHIRDGSGLSRYNHVSADLVMQLLRTIYKNDTVMPTLLEALPIAGEDGTLAWIDAPELQHIIRAKTGSMSGVYNIAGYITIGNKHYAFVLLNNGSNMPTSQYKQHTQEILRNLVQSLLQEKITLLH